MDAVIYPKFDSTVAADAREQTLRTIVDSLVSERGDYRDIFTTRRTFLTQALASIYDIPLANDMPNGSPDQWHRYDFPAEDPRRGILTNISFLALHSHPGKTSPTLRGKAFREIMMCQHIPAPPADVNFAEFQGAGGEGLKTARQRLIAHATQPSCSGCHKITDPIGLAMERFDGIGQFRETENGAPIDTTGTLDGSKFDGIAELGAAVRDNPAVPTCLVNRLSAYALGRTPERGESAWINELKAQFAESGYVVPELMRRIAMSPELYRAAPPKAPAKPKEIVAANGN